MNTNRKSPIRKGGIAILSVLILALLISSTAFAAPPANDDFDSATVITSLPFTDSLNTGEATTAADDPDCVGQGPTVWYAFTPSTDIRLEANTFGSDYDTTVSAYTGTRGNLTQIACNDDAGGTVQSRIRFDALAGETYFFMVGAFASGPGGNLVFTLQEAPPAPPPLELELSIDRFGSFSPRTGEATISGTVTCSRPVFVFVGGEVKQTVGRFIIRGFFFTGVECDGTTAWSATAAGENGRFAGGRAEVSAFAEAFDPENEEFVFVQAFSTVTLRGGKK